MIPLNEKVWSGRLQAVWILLAAAGTTVQFEIDSSPFTRSGKLSIATISAAVCSFILLSVVAHVLFNPDVPYNRRLLVVALTICGYMIVFSFHFGDYAGVFRNLLGAGVLFYLIWYINESTPAVKHQLTVTSFVLIFYISIAAILSMPFGVVVELTHLKRGNTIGAASVGVFTSFIIASLLGNRLFGPHGKFTIISIHRITIILSITYFCCLLMGVWLIEPVWFQPSGKYITYKLAATTSFFIITIATAFAVTTYVR